MVGKNAAKTIDQLPVGIIGCDISATGFIGETSAMPETKGRRPAITAISSVFICRFVSIVVSTITLFSRVCRRDCQRKCRVALSADVYFHPLFAHRGWNDDFSPLAGFETPQLERQYAEVVQLLRSRLDDCNVGHSSRGQVNV
jgi:hypothetical protein